MEAPPWIRAMLDPAFYPHGPERVRLIETHISWVFLTGEYAYKVKKPVDFGFLDFRTLESRRRFAHEELRLNRRLSPEVYLGVLEIRERNGGYGFEGEGQVVDVALWMRELEEGWRLDRLLPRGVEPRFWELLGAKIAWFHRESETSPYIASFGEPERVMVNIRENFEQTEAFIDITIPRGYYLDLRDYSYGFLQERKDLFRKRIEEGRVREGHGDLHTENIYYDGQRLYILDCIEFNERFRFQDTASDVAFLTMDLEAKGYEVDSWRFLNAYLESSGDFGMLEVLRFYKIYRAYVRGKIHSFQLGTVEEAKRRARGYFELAWRYLVEEPRRFLIATCGPMGSGKTTLAKELASRLKAVLVRSDALRKLSLGLDPSDHRYEPFGHGIYSPEVTERVYAAMAEVAQGVLEAGYGVVLDATFSRASQRRMMIALARRLGVPYLFLKVECPPEVLRERLSRREDISDGRVEILEDHLRAFEPPEEIPAEGLLAIDTTSPLDFGAIMAQLGERLR